MMEWGVPLNFIWFWTAPAALVVFALSSWRKKRAMARFGDPALVEKLILSFDVRKHVLKRALMLFSLLFIVLALCQPHFRTKEITVERKGVDVMIAVDASHSMLAKDIAPTRLDKAKLELSTLIEKLKQDRIGIVAFAGEAYIQCPLTLDKNAVKLFLSTLNPNLIPTPGTALGAALRVSLAAFTEKDKDDKVIILLTDGEDHESDPKRAAKLAKEVNAHIFTIGIGTPDGSTLPGNSSQEGAKRDRQGRVVLSKLDEKLLKELAAMTDGRYYRASRGELEIESISMAIRSMGQKGFRKDKIIQYDENYQMLLLPALILLLLEWALSERKNRFAWFTKRSAGIWLLFFVPFLVGFNFISQVKNEEGNRYYKKGQLGKAKSAYQSALRGEPSSPVIAFNLGNAYYKEGSFKEAVRDYARAAQAERDRVLQPQAFYNLGNGYYKENDLNKAAQYYKEALRLNSHDEDAKYNLELVLKKQQQDKKDKEKNKDKDKNQDKKGGQGSDGQQGGSASKDDGQKDGQQKDKGQEEQKDKGQGESKGEGQEEQKDKGQDQGQDESQGEGKEEQKDQGQGQGEGEQEKDKKEEPEKTPEQARAEQLLNALEGQEKQVMREQGTRQAKAAQSKRYVDKDW